MALQRFWHNILITALEPSVNTTVLLLLSRSQTPLKLGERYDVMPLTTP